MYNKELPPRPVMTRFIFACILGVLAAYAVCWYRDHLSYLGLGSIGVSLVIVAIFVRYCATARFPERPALTVVGALLFAALSLLGEVFSRNGTFADLAHPSAFFCLLGYWAVSALVLHAIFAWSQISEHEIEMSESRDEKKHSRSFFSRHCVFLTALGIILAGWLVVIIALFPGLGFYDSLWQLSQFRDYTSLSTHHPLSATVIMGIFSTFFSIFDDSVMFACYTLVQSLLCASALAYVATCIMRCFAPAEYLQDQRSTASFRIGGATGRNAYCCAVAFFAVMPLFPIYAMSIIKDQPYAVSITLAVLLLISVFSKKAVVPSRAFCILYCVSMAGIAGFRNEGWIVATVITVIMVIANHGTRKWFIAIVGAAIVILAFGVNSVVASALGATPGSTIETFALPNQQIAREMKDHPESFSEGELQQLSNMLVSEATPDMLGERYSPDNADEVKMLFDWNGYSRRSALSIWFNHLAMHPVTYIEAFLSGSSGYYYPFTEKMIGSVFDSFQWLQPEVADVWRQYFNVPDQALDPEYPQSTESMRRTFLECLRGVYNLPVFNALFSPATYVWCALLSALIIVNKRRYSKLWVLVPALLVVGMCVLAPINGSIRYALPLLYCAPLLLSFACSLSSDMKKRLA